MNFSGANYIIMGGTTGMGLSSALALKQAGAKIAVVGLSEQSCENAQKHLGTEGVIVQSGDATDPHTVEACIEAAHNEFGFITGLFHVAGGSGRKYGDGPLHEITSEGWYKTIELNLTSVLLSNRAIVKYFLRHSLPGIILNMSSVLGFSPSPGYFATHSYAAAKAGIIGFSRSIAAYYAKNDIRVNVIAPGLFDTPMAKRAVENNNIQSFLKSKQPLDGGRPGNPDDISEAVLLLLSPGSKLITGQVLAVDGGWSLSEGQIV